jgi:2-dehydropantoate 2-reductase
MKTPTYGLIGRGRVATHMAHYLGLENRRVIHWHRDLGSEPESSLHDAHMILLAISDDAIEPFLEEHGEFHDRPVVHFSGSLIIEGAHGLHPVMTFGPETYDLGFYRAIPFVSELGGAAFDEIFPGLQNPSRPIHREDKPLYHALCALAGNSTTILWAKAMDDFETRLGLPRDILRPFLQRTAANSLDLGRDALTGSLARNDRGTIARDIEGLTGDPYREVYLALAKAFAAERSDS